MKERKGKRKKERIKVYGKNNPAKGKERKKERIKVYGKKNPAKGTERKN